MEKLELLLKETEILRTNVEGNHCYISGRTEYKKKKDQIVYAHFKDEDDELFFEQEYKGGDLLVVSYDWKENDFGVLNLNKVKIKRFYGRTHQNWQTREPWITQDPDFKRIWLHPEPLRYYLTRDKSGLWSVVDRWWDLAVTDNYATRNQAIRRFYKDYGRKIGRGVSLKTFEEEKYT